MTESTIDPALAAKLKRLRLRAELPDQETLTIKRVPANHSFNKDRTNLLIKKRAIEGMPCVVCVDDDLDYLGSDPSLAQAFAAAPTQQGWRILTLGGSLHGDLSSALDYALGILGAEEESSEASGQPSEPSHANNTLLAAWADDLTHKVAAGKADQTLFRDEAIEQVAACALAWQGRMPLILGAPGTGKTNLLHGVATLLARRQKEVLSVNMGAIMAGTLFESERETLLASLLREAQNSGAILALEQAEWATIGVARSQVLLREALDHGVRMIATSSSNHEQRFTAHPLGSRLEIVPLAELCPSDTLRILAGLRPSIAAHHGVEIDAKAELVTVERSLALEGALPGKAIKLLDAAAARASLNAAPSVSELDVYIAASRVMPEE